MPAATITEAQDKWLTQVSPDLDAYKGSKHISNRVQWAIERLRSIKEDHADMAASAKKITKIRIACSHRHKRDQPYCESSVIPGSKYCDKHQRSPGAEPGS